MICELEQERCQEQPERKSSPQEKVVYRTQSLGDKYPIAASSEDHYKYQLAVQNTVLSISHKMYATETTKGMQQKTLSQSQSRNTLKLGTAGP